MSSDRRESRRRAGRLRVRLWSGNQEVMGFSTNLSESGLYVEAQSTLPIGSRVHVEITDRQGECFLGEALVVRHRRVPARLRGIKRPGMGLRLISPTELLDPEGPAICTQVVDDGPLRLDLSDPARLETALDEEIAKGVLAAPATRDEPIGARLTLRVALPPPWSEVSWSGDVMQKLEADPPLLVLRLADPELVASLAREVLSGIDR